MNKNISISLFRVSGDRKYLDMIFSCPDEYHFTSLELEARFVGNDGNFHSSFFDLSEALFTAETKNQNRFVVRVPLEKLGLTVPAIYIATFKADIPGSNSEDIEVDSSVLTVKKYTPDTDAYSELIQSNGLENVILYGTEQPNAKLSCGKICIRFGQTVFEVHQIEDNGFLHFTALDETIARNTIVKHNNDIINPDGLNYNIYNLCNGDTISFITTEADDYYINYTFIMTEGECNPGYITYENSEESNEITDTAICSDVVEAYRCMMDDLFMSEKDSSCKDLVSDEVIRKYLLIYGHTAAMAAKDLDTAQEYFRLIGNCFDKCEPKGRGQGSCCSGSYNGKHQYIPIHINSCNCGR